MSLQRRKNIDFHSYFSHVPQQRHLLARRMTLNVLANNFLFTAFAVRNNLKFIRKAERKFFIETSQSIWPQNNFATNKTHILALHFGESAQRLRRFHCY